MTFEKFEKYIADNKDLDDFIGLMNWIGIDCDEDLANSLDKYLWENYRRTMRKMSREKCRKIFYKFFEKYK